MLKSKFSFAIILLAIFTVDCALDPVTEPR